MAADQSIHDTRRAIGWFLVGMLLTTFLLNAAAFLSPMWAAIRYGDIDAATHLSDLHNFALKITPWFSAAYLAASWYIANTIWPKVFRFSFIALAFIAIAVPLLQRIWGPDKPNLVLESLLLGLQYVLFAIGTWQAWRTLR